MILFIYGPTQAGKTLLARRLARKTGALALSLDLLKMGLIRSGMLPCTPLEDERIEQLMWPPCASSCKRRSKTTKTSSSKATICRPSGATTFNRRCRRRRRSRIFRALRQVRIRGDPRSCRSGPSQACGGGRARDARRTSGRARRRARAVSLPPGSRTALIPKMRKAAGSFAAFRLE